MDYIIKAEDEGKMLRELLRRDLKLSATLMRRLKTVERGITLDGEQVTVRAVVRAGQLLRLRSEDTESSPNITPTEGQLDIVWEDDDLMVINKPFGMPVHPSPGHGEDTVANILAYRAQMAGEKFVFRAINRLDSGTGGLMCVAKNAHTAAALSAALGEKHIKRTYRAILEGELESGGGSIDLPIGICDGSGIKRCVRADGERAITHYRVLERKNGLTHAEIELETGRTHQIRVHFSHLGHPVWGDFMYGEERAARGWALFSCALELEHPRTGERVCVAAALPELFERLMK